MADSFLYSLAASMLEMGQNDRMCKANPNHDPKSGEFSSGRVVLWALPKGRTDRLHERPMTSFPLTHEQADKVEAAARADGWHGFRRVNDTNRPPDFTAGIKKADDTTDGEGEALYHDSVADGSFDAEVEKGNPNHDARGRFATGQGAKHVLVSEADAARARNSASIAQNAVDRMLGRTDLQADNSFVADVLPKDHLGRWTGKIAPGVSLVLDTWDDRYARYVPQAWKDRYKLDLTETALTLAKPFQDRGYQKVTVGFEHNGGHEGFAVRIAGYTPPKGDEPEMAASALRFWNGRTVEHDNFHINQSQQGKGLAKAFLGASMALYQKAGINKVTVGTADVGSYTWAKFGFAPTNADEFGVASTIRHRVTRLAGDSTVSNKHLEKLRDLSNHLTDNPRNIWKLADHKRGKDLLLNTGWQGELDLTDKSAMKRFWSYVHTPLAKLARFAVPPILSSTSTGATMQLFNALIAKDSPTVSDAHVPVPMYGGKRPNKKGPLIPKIRVDQFPAGPNSQAAITGAALTKATLFEDVLKANPNHDKLGRFASAHAERLSDTMHMHAREGQRIVHNGNTIFAGLGNTSGMHSFVHQARADKYAAGHANLSRKLRAVKPGDTLEVHGFENITRDRGRWVPQGKVKVGKAGVTKCDAGKGCKDKSCKEHWPMAKKSADGGTAFTHTVPFKVTKLDDEKQMVYGFASVSSIAGVEVVDVQDDVLDMAEITQAAHEFMKSHRVGGEMHGRLGTGDVVESLIVDAETKAALGITRDEEGWFIGYHVTDAGVWKDVKSGKYPAFSIGGTGTRVPHTET